jgi:hypothetical protein
MESVTDPVRSDPEIFIVDRTDYELSEYIMSLIEAEKTNELIRYHKTR